MFDMLEAADNHCRSNAEHVEVDKCNCNITIPATFTPDSVRVEIEINCPIINLTYHSTSPSVRSLTVDRHHGRNKWRGRGRTISDSISSRDARAWLAHFVAAGIAGRANSLWIVWRSLDAA